MLCGDGMASDPSEKCTPVLLDKIFHGTLLPGPVSRTCECEGLERSSGAHTGPQDRACSHHIKAFPGCSHHQVMVESIKT